MPMTMDREMLELLEPSAEALLDLPSSLPSATVVKETFLTTTDAEDKVLDILSAAMFTLAVVIMLARVIMNQADSGKFNISWRWRFSTAAKSFRRMLKAKLTGDDALSDEHDFENLEEYNPDEDPLYCRIDPATLLSMRPQREKTLPKDSLHTEADPHQQHRRARFTPPTASASFSAALAQRGASDVSESSPSNNRWDFTSDRRGAGEKDRSWESLRRKPVATTRSAGGAPGLTSVPYGEDNESTATTNTGGASALLATVLREEPVSSAAKPGSLSGGLSGVSLRPSSLSGGVSLRPARKL